jgi:hypothetical protein
MVGIAWSIHVTARFISGEESRAVPGGSDARSWKVLYPALTDTVLAKTRYPITFDTQKPTALRITATPADIEEFERVLYSELARQNERFEVFQ